VLLAYKKENAKFYERKEQYKAHIADLEQQVEVGRDRFWGSQRGGC